jgi:GTP-binding protein Era
VRDRITDSHKCQKLFCFSALIFLPPALPTRFFTSELIRESLFESLKKELPYCCEVRVDSFLEPKPDDKKKVSRIKATIYVERESQKIIVIGKGGEQIKNVGIRARDKIEKFLQEKVHLELTGK